MAVRNFAANNAYIRCAQDALNLTGAFWMFVRFKRGANGTYHSLIAIENTAGTTLQWSLELDTANHFDAATNTTSNLSAGTVVAADGWIDCFITKAAGTAAVRFHFRKAGGAWTHQNASGTIGNQASLTGGRIVFGEWKGVDDYSGRVAVAAIGVGATLTDLQCEGGLTNKKTSEIAALSPTSLWEFNQASTGTSVLDLIANADQSATQNTTVVTGDDDGWTFDGVGGTVYTKTGQATAASVASGADATTTSETGAGVAASVGSGADVDTTTETGTAISPAVASGGDAVTTAETGAAQSEAKASGASSVGRGYNKTGAAVASAAGSGADATVSAETTTATSVAGAAGGDVVAFVEAGSAAVDLTAAGSDATTVAESGSGASTATGAGQRAVFFTKTGASIGASSASGAKAVIWVERGAGSSSAAGSGAYVFTGAVVEPPIVEAPTYLTITTTSSALSAGGTTSSLIVQPPVGSLAVVGGASSLEIAPAGTELGIEAESSRLEVESERSALEVVN